MMKLSPSIVRTRQGINFIQKHAEVFMAKQDKEIQHLREEIASLKKKITLIEANESNLKEENERLRGQIGHLSQENAVLKKVSFSQQEEIMVKDEKFIHNEGTIKQLRWKFEHALQENEMLRAINSAQQQEMMDIDDVFTAAKQHARRKHIVNQKMQSESSSVADSYLGG